MQPKPAYDAQMPKKQSPDPRVTTRLRPWDAAALRVVAESRDLTVSTAMRGAIHLYCGLFGVWPCIAFHDDERLTIALTNAPLQRYLGYEAHELLGRSALDLLPPGAHPTIEVIVDQLREARGLKKFRLTLLHKSGEQVKVKTWAFREAHAFGHPMIIAGWTPAEVLDAWKQKHPAMR
jgi:PAS domain-containing protein